MSASNCMDALLDKMDMVCYSDFCRMLIVYCGICDDSKLERKSPFSASIGIIFLIFA